MDKVKKRWRSVPGHVRRPLVLVAGVALIIAAPLIGWIPGPGGMVLFLLGIAVLASEFTWAVKVRDRILDVLKQSGRYAKKNPLISVLIVLAAATMIVLGAYGFYNYII